MTLRTPIGYISQVCAGYLLLSEQPHAITFATADDVRSFLRDHAHMLPDNLECVQP